MKGFWKEELELLIIELLGIEDNPELFKNELLVEFKKLSFNPLGMSIIEYIKNQIITSIQGLGIKSPSLTF